MIKNQKQKEDQEMKKILLLVGLMLLVAAPAFAQQGFQPGNAFNPLYGIFIPGPGTPIQLSGGAAPAAKPLADQSKAENKVGAFNTLYGIFIPAPGTPIQLSGGATPPANCLGDQSKAENKVGAFNTVYGIFIPMPGTPVQLTGGATPPAKSLGGK